MSECHDIYPLTEGQPARADDKGEVSTVSLAHPANGGHPRAKPGTAHDCEVLSEEHGGVRVVRVVGPLDWATAGRFEGFLCDDCVEPVVVVNLTASHLDAAGTGALLVATERAAAHGQQIVLVATDPLQLSVLHSTGLNLVVPIVDSEAAALTWCERHYVPVGSVPIGTVPVGTVPVGSVPVGSVPAGTAGGGEGDAPRSAAPAERELTQR